MTLLSIRFFSYSRAGLSPPPKVFLLHSSFGLLRLPSPFSNDMHTSPPWSPTFPYPASPPIPESSTCTHLFYVPSFSPPRFSIAPYLLHLTLCLHYIIHNLPRFMFKPPPCLHFSHTPHCLSKLDKFAWLTMNRGRMGPQESMNNQEQSGGKQPGAGCSTPGCSPWRNPGAFHSI